MAKAGFNVRLREDQLAAMEKLIEHDPELDKSAIIRRALDNYLNLGKKKPSAELIQQNARRAGNLPDDAPAVLTDDPSSDSARFSLSEKPAKNISGPGARSTRKGVAKTVEQAKRTH